MQIIYAILALFQWNAQPAPVPVSYSGPPLVQVVCSGQIPIGTAAIKPYSIAQTLAVPCTGALASDSVLVNTSGNVFAVLGFVPSNKGILAINPSMAAGLLNINVANGNATALTPGALTLTYQVTRTYANAGK